MLFQPIKNIFLLYNKNMFGPYNNKKGFTLIELLVVIAIIGMISSVILASISNARKKANDARRLSDIKQLHNALALYYDKYGTYPPTTGYTFQDPSSCNGTLATALNVLVTEGFIGKIPDDPINSPSPWGSNGRFCLFYYTNTRCNDASSGLPVRPYAIRFTTESSVLRIPYQNWYGQPYHWCAFP
jgi:general secretion pathway protein G